MGAPARSTQATPPSGWRSRAYTGQLPPPPAAVCVNPGAHPRDGDPVARLSAALVSHRVVQARRQTPVRRLVVKKRWKNKNRSRVGSETSRAPARMTGGGVFE